MKKKPYNLGAWMGFATMFLFVTAGVFLAQDPNIITFENTGLPLILGVIAVLMLARLAVFHDLYVIDREKKR